MKITVQLESYEVQLIRDLAYLVRHSKQNVGRRLTDQADSVLRLCDQKLAPTSPTATN